MFYLILSPLLFSQLHFSLHIWFFFFISCLFLYPFIHVCVLHPFTFLKSLSPRLSPFYFFYPLSSMWADEPGDPRSGHIHGLCSRKCPAVSDRRNAHSSPLHPEKRGWCAPHCLPAQPQPRRGELHLGCPSTCSNQRRPAYPCVGAALAEVHHLLWEWLRWVGTNIEQLIRYLYIRWSQLFHLNINASQPTLMSGADPTATEVKLCLHREFICWKEYSRSRNWDERVSLLPHTHAHTYCTCTQLKNKSKFRRNCREKQDLITSFSMISILMKRQVWA